MYHYHYVTIAECLSLDKESYRVHDFRSKNSNTGALPLSRVPRLKANSGNVYEMKRSWEMGNRLLGNAHCLESILPETNSGYPERYIIPPLKDPAISLF